MKNIYSIFILLSIAAITTTSCNKTYQCECKSQGRILTVTPIKNLGKLGAKNVCDSYQTQNNLQSGSQVCSLK